MLNCSYSLAEEFIFFAYRNSDKDLRARFSFSRDFSCFFPIIFFIIRLDLLVLCKTFVVRILAGFSISNFLVKGFWSSFHSFYLRFRSFRNCSFYYVDPQLKSSSHIFLNFKFEIEVPFVSFLNHQFIYFSIQWFPLISYSTPKAW